MVIICGKHKLIISSCANLLLFIPYSSLSFPTYMVITAPRLVEQQLELLVWAGLGVLWLNGPVALT